MNLIIVLLTCFCGLKIYASKLPGPLVYVVTPSPRPQQINEPRSVPFYYHNWMRRMDMPSNTTTTTTTTPKTKTPDLIFAEFESESGDNMRKSIRKLLEKERIESKTTSTTSKPIYVPDDESDQMEHELNYGLPNTTEEKEKEPKLSDMENYYAMYNQMYNNKNTQAPVYLPLPSTASTISTTTTTAAPAPVNVENIWHIIDSEKHDQWDEIPIKSDDKSVREEEADQIQQYEKKLSENHEDNYKVDDNFVFPGFSTNPGNGAENESRAIRTEPNIRFPYVNLKPFQMKNFKKPSNDIFLNSKKGNNVFTNLDSFQEVKNPVRGEAQDIVAMRQPVDRYNPAQPYLPPTNYATKSKQFSPNLTPAKTVANLVPPPPPPSPKLTDNDFPAPSSYEAFPPYASSIPDSAPIQPPKLLVPMFQPPDDSDSSSSPDNSDDNAPIMDLGYRYKPPSPQAQQFVPTLPPLTKPFNGYTYDKPIITAEAPPPLKEMDEKPNFHGYHYNKPEPATPPENHSPSYSYDHHDHHEHHPTYHHDSDYPELIYDKPHGGMNSDTKGGDDMGMMPPPPPPDMNADMKPDMDSPVPPADDHGFPHDFPGDLKFHHDFDDHDLYHYHHHHHPTTTTTTTTTEMPRVNRYSYYYLGKKLYYLPLYFSVYFIVYVGALIIKAVLRHKIVYPNSWRPNDQTATFFSKRSIDSWDLSNESLHEVTGKVTHAIVIAAEKYMNNEVK